MPDLIETFEWTSRQRGIENEEESTLCVVGLRARFKSAQYLRCYRNETILLNSTYSKEFD